MTGIGGSMINSTPMVNTGWYAQAHERPVHETSAAMKTALIVEDDQSIARLIRDYLDRAGYGVAGEFRRRRAGKVSPFRQ